MSVRLPSTSLDPGARAIGLVSLLYFVAAIGGAMLASGLVAVGDAGATARIILAHERMYQSGVAVSLVANVLYIALAALFYTLFRPVSQRLSLIAAFVALAGCALQIGGVLLQAAPLIMLNDAQYTGAIGSSQAAASAYTLIELQTEAVKLALVVFAVYDLLIGYLVIRGTFLPRFLGVLLVMAGVGWLSYLWPPLATSISVFVQPLGFVAELALMMWLLFKGVNVVRWRELVLEGARGS